MEKSNHIKNSRKIYIIGIAGISMSGIAEYLKALGKDVSGSDPVKNDISDNLKKQGITVNKEHLSKNISPDTDLVIYSLAIKDDNPELVQAKYYGIPCIKRGEALGLISQEFKHTIAIAGTHGKTTTTAMIYHIFKYCGKEPTLHIGGKIGKQKQNFIIGGKEFFITEACEYGDSFLSLRPEVSIVNNIEKEHLDYFGNMKNVYNSYNKFMLYSKRCFVGSGCKNKLLTHNQDYFGKGSATFATCIKEESRGVSFDAYVNNKLYGKVSLKVHGKHNVHNCLAAIKVADYYKLSKDKVLQALRDFGGVERRFEYIGKLKGNDVIFDYAHHPSEIKTCIKTAQKVYKNDLFVFFQPHTYSRTKTLKKEFVGCFKGVKSVFVCSTYKAREKYDKDGDAAALALAIKEGEVSCVCTGDIDDIVSYLRDFDQKGTLLFVGAGDMQDNLLQKIAQTNLPFKKI